MANRMMNFQSPGFPHNFAKKTKSRQSPNMGSIDASRRQVQSVIKLGLKYIFRRKMVGLLYIRKVPNFCSMQLPRCAESHNVENHVPRMQVKLLQASPVITLLKSPWGLKMA